MLDIENNFNTCWNFPCNWRLCSLTRVQIIVLLERERAREKELKKEWKNERMVNCSTAKNFERKLQLEWHENRRALYKTFYKTMKVKLEEMNCFWKETCMEQKVPRSSIDLQTSEEQLTANADGERRSSAVWMLLSLQILENIFTNLASVNAIWFRNGIALYKMKNCRGKFH